MEADVKAGKKRKGHPSEEQSSAKIKKTEAISTQEPQINTEETKNPNVQSKNNFDSGKSTINKNELFVRNLKFTEDEDSIGDYFSTYGTVVGVKILKTGEDKSKGIAFVKFTSEEDCAAALKALNGATWHDRVLSINYSGETAFTGNNIIFVSNIPFSANQKSIHSYFSECGTIKSIKMPLRSNGSIRGFAHIIFDTPEMASKALQLTGQEFEGRKLNIDMGGTKGAGSMNGKTGVKERPKKRKYKGDGPVAHHKK